jgi:hypothetical protein
VDGRSPCIAQESSEGLLEGPVRSSDRPAAMQINQPFYGPKIHQIGTQDQGRFTAYAFERKAPADCLSDTRCPDGLQSSKPQNAR